LRYRAGYAIWSICCIVLLLPMSVRAVRRLICHCLNEMLHRKNHRSGCGWEQCALTVLSHIARPILQASYVHKNHLLCEFSFLHLIHCACSAHSFLLHLALSVGSRYNKIHICMNPTFVEVRIYYQAL